MTAALITSLLRLPVRMNGIELARPVDALVDRDGELIGLEIRCGDGSRRFLPAPAAEILADEIRVGSALVFLDARELAWYRERTTSAA
jgi:hypothetical protein